MNDKEAPMNVAMTVEPEEHGYGQHSIIVERGNGDSVQYMVLTDMELDQLACMIENHRAHNRTASAEFADPTGRPPVIEEQHGPYGVVS
jgi:hypothetical protein